MDKFTFAPLNITPFFVPISFQPPRYNIDGFGIAGHRTGGGGGCHPDQGALLWASKPYRGAGAVPGAGAFGAMAPPKAGEILKSVHTRYNEL